MHRVGHDIQHRLLGQPGYLVPQLGGDSQLSSLGRRHAYASRDQQDSHSGYCKRRSATNVYSGKAFCLAVLASAIGLRRCAIRTTRPPTHRRALRTPPGRDAYATKTLQVALQRVPHMRLLDRGDQWHTRRSRSRRAICSQFVGWRCCLIRTE